MATELDPTTETKRKRTSDFTPPREIWGLLIEEVQEGDFAGIGKLLRAIDGDGEPFLAFHSQAEAIDGAIFHLSNYGIGCTPVRLK